MPTGRRDEGAPTRRQFLGRAGVLAGVVGLPSVAGCLSGSGAERAGYTDWLAEPELFGGRRYFFEYYDVAAIRDQRDSFNRAVYGAYREWTLDGYEHYDLPFEAVEEALFGVNRRVTVLRGEWDRSTVGEYLERTGYVRAGTHSGFDLYRHRLAELAVALDDNRLLRAQRTSRSPLGTVRLFVQVGGGEKRRYVQADAVIAELTRRLGTGTYIFGFPHRQTETTDRERGEFRRGEARGLARTVDGAETTDRVVVTFADDSDVEAALPDLKAWAESAPLFRGATSLRVDTEGRSALVTVRRRTATLDAVTLRL